MGLEDKEFLLEMAEAFDKAERSEPNIIKVSEELAELISLRVREIANRMK